VTKVARSFSSHNLQRTCGLSLTKTTRQCFADHPDGAKELGRRGFSTGGGIVGIFADQADEALLFKMLAF
jgi:hypothetical protein